MTIDTRLLAFIIWGIGMVVVYGFVLIRRLRSWGRFRSRQNGRDVIESFGLFLVAVASATSIFATLFTDSTGFRVFLGAIAAGALLAVGLVMASEQRDT